ncbi:MAG: type I methionyl aminopeptidase [Candidatus Parcubacteria bacterium]|nr:type I methionyl aminopeptidase [Candidatus Parcubacteria bacterium]
MITIKSPEEIKIMTEGGKILAEIMEELQKMVRPGVKTKEIDKAAEDLVLKYGAKCSFKDFRSPEDEINIPYPSCLCTSINEEIVHAIPSERVLKEGDIISLDLGIFFKGFHSDMALTIPIGKVDSEAGRLIRITRKSLKRALKKVVPGKRIGAIGNTIQKYVESQGFNVVRELCGHGIGKELHEDPQIMNFGKEGQGEKIKEGMVLCLEPMVTIGDYRIKKGKDGFGYITQDGSLSAHFEHTVVVTKNGPRVITSLSKE